MRLAGFVCAAALVLVPARAFASTPIFLDPEAPYTPYYGSGDGAIDAQWDSPVVGKHGTRLLDLIYRNVADCVSRPSYDVPSNDVGCGGQCVELTSRWLALYVNHTTADDSKTWIMGNGGSGYCDCARGQCGQNASLYEVHNWGDRTTPRAGDVLSFSYVHAAIVTHVWADDSGIHISLANQNLTMTTTQDWYSDHFTSESCLVHAVEMPQFQRQPSYAVDLNGDGFGDVCGRAGDGIHCSLGGPEGFSGDIAGPKWSDASGWWLPKYASTIQYPDIDGDRRADVCGRSSKGIVCNPSTGNGFGAEIDGPAWSDASGWGNVQYYGTIRFPDINGDGLADVCGRAGDGIHCSLSTGKGFGPDIVGPALSDAAGWDQAPYVSTIQFADINGDGKDDVCGRGKGGIECWLSDGKGFPTHITGPGTSDHAAWGRDYYYGTIQFADLDGDGKADICARDAKGIVCYLSTGSGFGPEIAGPAWSDSSGWMAPRQWQTIQILDFDGDGKRDICGRASEGIECARFTGTAFEPVIKGPAWSDATGWTAPEYFMTIAATDVNGDGRDDLCARGANGVTCALSNGAGFSTTATGPAWSDANGWSALHYYSTVRFAGAALVHAKPASSLVSKTAPVSSNGTNSSSQDLGCACSSAPKRSAGAWEMVLAALAAGIAVARRRSKRTAD